MSSDRVIELGRISLLSFIVLLFVLGSFCCFLLRFLFLKFFLGFWFFCIRWFWDIKNLEFWELKVFGFLGFVVLKLKKEIAPECYRVCFFEF